MSDNKRVEELEDEVAKLMKKVEDLTEQLAHMTELAMARGERTDKLEDRIRRMERLAIRDEIERDRKVG